MVTKIASQLAIPLTTVSRIRFWFRVDSIVEKALQMEGRLLRGKRKGIEIIRIWFDSRIFAFVVHKRGMASSFGWSKRHERFFVFPIPSFAFAVMHRDTDIGEHGSRVVLSTPVLSPDDLRQRILSVGSRESNYLRIGEKCLVASEIDVAGILEFSNHAPTPFTVNCFMNIIATGILRFYVIIPT